MRVLFLYREVVSFSSPHMTIIIHSIYQHYNISFLLLIFFWFTHNQGLKNFILSYKYKFTELSLNILYFLYSTFFFLDLFLSPYCGFLVILNFIYHFSFAIFCLIPKNKQIKKRSKQCFACFLGWLESCILDFYSFSNHW